MVAEVRTRRKIEPIREPEPAASPPQQIIINPLDTSDGRPRLMLVEVMTDDGPQIYAQPWCSWVKAKEIHDRAALTLYGEMVSEIQTALEKQQEQAAPAEIAADD